MNLSLNPKYSTHSDDIETELLGKYGSKNTGNAIIK